MGIWKAYKEYIKARYTSPWYAIYEGIFLAVFAMMYSGFILALSIAFTLPAQSISLEIAFTIATAILQVKLITTIIGELYSLVNGEPKLKQWFTDQLSHNNTLKDVASLPRNM